MRKFYVSTGAFKTKNIEELLECAYKNKIYNIELSSGLDYNEKTIDIVKQEKNTFNFLVHNYFPSPKNPFALNLASADCNVIEKSMNLCKQAVDLVRECNGEIYSLHCGFAFDCSGKELGNSSQLNLKKMPLRIAYRNFISNIRELCSYGKSKNVKIAIENNVFAEYAAIENSDIYLGVTTKDLQYILTQVQNDNLYILLDIAHAKVSNTFKNFGLEQMIDELEKNIIIVHLSDNNASLDQNFKIDCGSNIIPYIKQLKNKIFVLESYNLEPSEIHEQLMLLEEIIND